MEKYYCNVLSKIEAAKKLLCGRKSRVEGGETLLYGNLHIFVISTTFTALATKKAKSKEPLLMGVSPICI